MENYQSTMKRILKIFKNIYFPFYQYLSNSEKKAKFYRKHFGVKIGKNVRFTCGKQNWGSEPYLIEIGDNVTITQNITFHTHDGGVGVLRKEFPGINIFGRIKIGDNVFIGSNSIFLPGVTVGNNVVIASGSVITKDIPDDVVVAGVPAKIIKNIDEYKQSILKKATFLTENDPEKRKKIIIKRLEKK